jgi:hypothetical protein
MGGEAKWALVWPQLSERTTTQNPDPQYFHQAGWAARHIGERRPSTHHDVGAEPAFLATLTGFTEVVSIELRPLATSMPRLTTQHGDLLDLAIDDHTVESLSCLHVLEHVGLGRYGDTVDPAGTAKAARDLSRVLAPGGALYVSLPIGGDERVEFNAHRVHSVGSILEMFGELSLTDFAIVDDAGQFHDHQTATADWSHLYRGLGMFAFTR